MDIKLSRNFSLLEFTRSQKADELGIDNIPNHVHIVALQAWCDNIGEPIRAHFNLPVKVLSGFRSEELNKAVGGSPTSQHTKGEAVDIEVPGIRNDVLWKFIVDHLDYDQVIAEQIKAYDGSAGWIHVSYRRVGKQRNEALSFLGKGKYVTGLEYA